MKKITKKMTFAELIELDPALIEPLLNKGMHCIGCPMSQMESIEDGAIAHGMNPDKLVKELNENLLEKRLRKKAKAEGIQQTDAKEKLKEKKKK